MTMNWGKGILIVFILFATLIGTLVFKSNGVKTELVTKNYYEEELAYQEKIDGITNAQRHDMNAAVSQDKETLRFQWPDSLNFPAEGELWFYYASDAGRDRKMRFTTTGSGVFELDKSVLSTGDYQVKISWEKAGKKYYQSCPVSIY